MSVNTNPVIGAVVIARHGDRAGFYQSPTTYTATATVITPLGETQEFQLGGLIRRTYLDPTSPTVIAGISSDVVVASQLTSTVDGGGEGGVIFDSAVALWQGVYPPSANLSTIVLSNGSSITSPLGGYQYLQINSVLPALDIDLESFVNCNTWTNQTAAFYASPAFVAKQVANKPFLDKLASSGLSGGRNVSLVNMWNIFDFMNVQSIHNATYAALLNATGPSTLAQARDLANWHEYYSFSSPTLGGIGNGTSQSQFLHPSLILITSPVAAQTFLPLIFDALNSFTVAAPVVKLAHFQIAYKPFLSLFNMTNAAVPNPQSIVDYASIATFELRKSMTGTGHDVRFGFRNGTDVGNIVYYPLFGSASLDTDLNLMISKLEPYLLNNITSWCNACNQTSASGCDLVYAAQQSSLALVQANATIASLQSNHSNLSNVGAGFVGAAVTLALGLALVAYAYATGKVGTKRRGGAVLLKRQGSYGSSIAPL